MRIGFFLIASCFFISSCGPQDGPPIKDQDITDAKEEHVGHDHEGHEHDADHVHLHGVVEYKKYVWSKTDEGWNDANVNYFLIDDNGKRLHLKGSDKVSEERLHEFVGKHVEIVATVVTDDGKREPGSVFPVDADGKPVKWPPRYHVTEIVAE